MRKIRIKAGKIELDGFLLEKNPETRDAIWSSLPLHGKAERWGDEIYFEIPVKMGEENPQEKVEIGDVAYWPPGNALCIFFGPTPLSKDEIIPYSPVNVFARIPKEEALKLKGVKEGETVIIERG
jgi:hypothetical protein